MERSTDRIRSLVITSVSPAVRIVEPSRTAGIGCSRCEYLSKSQNNSHQSRCGYCLGGGACSQPAYIRQSPWLHGYPVKRSRTSHALLVRIPETELRGLRQGCFRSDLFWDGLICIRSDKGVAISIIRRPVRTIYIFVPSLAAASRSAKPDRFLRDYDL